MPQRRRNTEIAVIGLGRFGTSLALALMARGYDVLGIDEDPLIVQRIADEITHAAVLDSTDEEALLEVDITTFDTVVVAIGSDFESNLLTTVALKSLGVRHVLSKAVTQRQREILMRVGADQVVLPEVDGGQRLAEELVAPAVLERLHLGPDHSVVELHAPSSLVGQTLGQLNLRSRMGVIVLVIKRQERLMVVPSSDDAFAGGDLLVVLGSNENLQRFSDLP